MATIIFCSINRTAQITARRCLNSHLKGFANAGESPLTQFPGLRWFSRGAGARFMSYGSAGKSAAGRARRGALALSGAAAVTAAAAVAGFLANANHFQRAEMSTSVSQSAEEKEQEDEGDIVGRCGGFMSPPLTDISVLQERKGDMRTRMEMLIMETQADFCKALEKVDGGKFKVDRWHRKEGETASSAEDNLQSSL